MSCRTPQEAGSIRRRIKATAIDACSEKKREGRYTHPAFPRLPCSSSSGALPLPRLPSPAPLAHCQSSLDTLLQASVFSYFSQGDNPNQPSHHPRPLKVRDELNCCQHAVWVRRPLRVWVCYCTMMRPILTDATCLSSGRKSSSPGSSQLQGTSLPRRQGYCLGTMETFFSSSFPVGSATGKQRNPDMKSSLVCGERARKKATAVLCLPY